MEIDENDLVIEIETPHVITIKKQNTSPIMDWCCSVSLKNLIYL